MKTLFAGVVATILAACAEQPGAGPGYVGPGQPPGLKTGSPSYSQPNSPFRKWTTAQLQQRRRELYGQIPQSQTRRGQPAFIHHGGEQPPSTQQNEIYAIEAELNRRYQAGDKDAELTRAMPGSQHPGATVRVESF
jgi:hypothetical protein